MILVDTSVWINFFSEKSYRQVAILEALIDEGEDLCLCGVVLTEVLQGIRDNRQYNKTKSILSNLIFLPMNRNTFFYAATIYRTLRAHGITIRNSVDCIISAPTTAYHLNGCFLRGKKLLQLIINLMPGLLMLYQFRIAMIEV